MVGINHLKRCPGATVRRARTTLQYLYRVLHPINKDCVLWVILSSETKVIQSPKQYFMGNQ